MTNEQILERQVEALEKLLQLKEAVINELENKVDKLQGQQISIGNGSGYQPINVPSVWTTPQPSWQCTDGQPHQYPQHWMSINAPCCTKCGQTPQSGYPGLGGAGGQGWTLQQPNIVGGAGGSGIVSTTGYIQPVTLVNTGNK